MNLNITVIAVVQTTRQGPKAPFHQLEVTYKNNQTGKVDAKKIMSFDENPFKALANAKAGDVFDVESVKNEKTGFWGWTTVVQAAPGGAVAPVESAKVGFTPAPKSNYETPEERAKKQVYIIRQSSISAAIATLSVGAKAPLKKEEVADVAQFYVDFVFQENKPTLTPLADMLDDVPM